MLRAMRILTGTMSSLQSVLANDCAAFDLTETIRLMAEIDQVIEIQGGWLAIFQTNLQA